MVWSGVEWIGLDWIGGLGKGKGEVEHTNDRRYESNDSREMGKWSISPLVLVKLGLLLVSLEVRER